MQKGLMQGLGSGSALADILQQALEQPDITFEEWQLYKYEVTMVLRVPDMCRQDQGDLDAVPGYNYAQLLGVRIDATLDEVHHSYSATLPATACCPEQLCSVTTHQIIVGITHHIIRHITCLHTWVLHWL